jgi:hypothetical protein
MSTNVKADEFTYRDLYAGQVNVMGTPMNLPDFGKWHYFAFDETQGVVFKGTSDFELENVNALKIGSEKVNSEWKARKDWDFAFHAYDMRTNSGLAGNGNVGAIFVADAASSGGKSLDEIYSALTEAPVAVYKADTTMTGSFYYSLTSGMPPMRATILSVCAASRKAADGETGASADFSTFAMQGPSSDNNIILVLRTVSGKYVKIFLKQFTEDGKPGILKFDYEFIPLKGGNGISTIKPENISVFHNSASNEIKVNLTENADIAIYNLTGSLVKEVKVKAGEAAIPVSGWAKGIYIVKINSADESRVSKVIVK